MSGSGYKDGARMWEDLKRLSNLDHVPVGRDFGETLGDLGAARAQEERHASVRVRVEGVEVRVHSDPRVTLEESE